MKTVVGGHGHQTTQSNLWMQKGKYKIENPTSNTKQSLNTKVQTSFPIATAPFSGIGIRELQNTKSFPTTLITN